MKKWLCVVCGLIYDEAKGWPDDGIEPGTRWEDVPEDWLCPDCGVSKEDFEMIEVSAEEAEKIEAAAEPITTTNNETNISSEEEAPLIIIGSGYAGYSLAAALREKNKEKTIILFTEDDGANYSKPGLSNALARNKAANELATETVLDIEQRLNIRIYAHCRVKEINADQHQIHTNFGIQNYSKLILALGASPIRLPLKGSGADDVLSVNNLADYHLFRDKLSTSRHVTIIGNGLIGCEFASDLSAQGYKVSVVGLTGWAMDRLLPQQIGEQLQAKLTEQDVSWHLENTVEQIDSTETGYRLTLADGQSFDSDLVLSAVGLKPNVELAQTASVECQRGIVVNDQLQTNVQDIYAIGDCIEVNGQLLPYIAPITFGIRALTSCLLGQATSVQYPLMPVVVKTPALPLVVLPPSPDQQGNWQVETTSTGMRGLYTNNEGQILGFALAGELTTERQQWMDKMPSGN